MKKLLNACKWIAAAAALVVAQHALGLPNTTITIVMGLAVLWYLLMRIDDLDQRTDPSSHDRIRKQIENGEPRVPQDDQPTSLADSGFKSLITSWHELIFNDFKWFCVIVNWGTDASWTLEETSSTLMNDTDEPDFGRGYDVYYRSMKMGTLQIGVGHDFKAERFAGAVLYLNHLQFVPYEHARQLVAAVEEYLGPFEHHEDYQASYTRASMAATAALTGFLWEAVRVRDADPGFEYRTEGPYDIVRMRAEHWNSNNINPLEVAA